MTRLPGRSLRRSRAGIGLALDAVAVLLAVWQCWGSRHALDPDGVAYLDLGAAWLRADWAAAWNPYWSPFYAWLVAGAEELVSPGPESLAVLVHAVNFGVFLFALGAFRFLLDWLGDGGWAWRCAAYGLFLEATLGRISLARTTPDLLLAGLLFLAVGLALERRGFALGCALGAAYLTKAAALPLAPVFVLAAVGWKPCFVGRALAGFVLVAGWWIAGLSWMQGSPTFGYAGKLNYAWNVLGVERPYSDRVERISDQPTAYVFDAFEVTYPLHYAPGYWRPDLELWWDAEKQWERLRLSFWKTVKLLLGPHWLLLIGLWLGGNRSLSVAARKLWISRAATVRERFCQKQQSSRSGLQTLKPEAITPLALPALAGLALYQPVFVAERYVAVFIALFWLGRLAAFRPSGRAFAVCALAFLTVVVVRVRPEPSDNPPPGTIAQALLHAGLPPGARVAAVWPGPPYLWARAAGVRIVAESREGPAAPQALLEKFVAAGADWAVAPCPENSASGWRSVPGTGLCLASLQSSRWGSTADPSN